MSWSLVVMLKNEKEVEAVVPSNWIKDKKAYWSNSLQAKRNFKNCIEINEDWPSYDLVKIKLSSDKII